MKRVGRQENAFIMLLIIQCREKGFNVFYPWHFLRISWKMVRGRKCNNQPKTHFHTNRNSSIQMNQSFLYYCVNIPLKTKVSGLD